MSGAGSSGCQYLPWDSEFFGIRIGSLSSRRLTTEIAQEALDWCEGEQIRCLYFLADMTDPETVALAEAHRFTLTDIRMTLERTVGPECPWPAAVRPFQESDLAVLRSIAAVSHRDTRFYFDRNFPEELCAQFYATWIDRSCHGYADAVFVAEAEGNPAGYISCHRSPGEGKIGLVAVAEGAGGRGLGRQLVEAAVEYFRQAGAARASVVTQGRNCPAQRLYQRCGFLTGSVNLWYHRWFPVAGNAK